MLYKSQAKILKRLQTRLDKRFGQVVQMDTGLGKTRVGLISADKNDLPVVFVVPSNMIDEWIAERASLGVRSEFQVLRKFDKPVALTNWVLASYNCLTYPAFTKAVGDRPRFIVVDELANFKNETAARTKQLQKLTETNSHRVVGLTATLVENSILELFTQVHIVAPKFMTRQRFINRHVVYNQWGGVDGYCKMNKFKRKAKRYILRLRREEVVHELPSKTVGHDYIYFVDPPVQHLERHKNTAGSLSKSLRRIRDAMAAAEMAGNEDEEAEQQYAATVGRVNSVRRIAALRKQLCDPQGLGRAKVEFIKKLFKHWLAPGKRGAFSGFPCVVFCDDVEAATALRDEIESWGFSVGLVTGATSWKARAELRRQFNAGELPVLVSSAAGSRGNNLQAGASLIHYSIPWNDAQLKQRNRIRRASSTAKEQRYILLVLRGTVDEHLLSIVRDKQHQASVFDAGTVDFVKSRSQTWTEFLQQLLRKEKPHVEKARKPARKHRNEGRPGGCSNERYWHRRG